MNKLKSNEYAQEDATTGTSDFDEKDDDPDDCYCESVDDYIRWNVEKYFEDNYDFVCESSNMKRTLHNECVGKKHADPLRTIYLTKRNYDTNRFPTFCVNIGNFHIDNKRNRCRANDPLIKIHDHLLHICNNGVSVSYSLPHISDEDMIKTFVRKHEFDKPSVDKNILCDDLIKAREVGYNEYIDKLNNSGLESDTHRMLFLSEMRLYDEITYGSKSLNVINEYVNDIIDHSYYKASDIESIVNDISAYIVLEEVEDAVCYDLWNYSQYWEANKTSDIINSNNYRSYLEYTAHEVKLKSRKENNMDDSYYGIPEMKTFPLKDEFCVTEAVRLFPNAPLKYKKSLAKNIYNKAVELNMDYTNWNNVMRYLNEEVVIDYDSYAFDMINEFFNDSFDIIQESSNKTNTRRKINKLKDDAKRNSISLKISPDEKTHASTNIKNKESTIYINPHDIQSSKNQAYKDIYNHEKNHILIDRRKKYHVADNRYVTDYLGKHDVSDIKLIEEFINVHKKDMFSPHTADKEEYLADLNAARDNSFNSVIKTLESLKIPINDKKLNSLQTYHFNDLKVFYLIDIDNSKYNTYAHTVHDPSLEDYKNAKIIFRKILDSPDRDEIINQQYSGLKNKIKEYKKILSSYDSYVIACRSNEINIDRLLNTYVKAYNTDLNFRIMFLKDMKRLFNGKTPRRLDVIEESYDYNMINPIERFSVCLGKIVDHSHYTAEQFDSMFNDLIHYVIIRESEININEEGDVIMENENKPLSEFDHFFQEAKMNSKKRKELDDSDFALVYTDGNGNKVRKYPINDEAHVKAAARMFPRGVPNKYRKEVAGKILRRAHKFGIDTEGWKSLNNAVKD